MDPTIGLITGAIAAGATAAFKDTAAQAVKDGYGGLKALIQQKFGDKSELTDAVKRLEDRPDSAGRKDVLAEEVSRSKTTEKQAFCS